VLHHEGLVIWDSLAICEYAAELYPEAKLWPSSREARAIARSVSAEMHAGFASLRGALPMDIAARHPRRVLSRETEDDVARVLTLFRECRARAAKLSGDEAGPFLFGRFSIADAMYAPVVWRFITYDVALDDVARAYCDAMVALPAMKEWEAAAIAEAEALARAREKKSESASATTAPDPRSAQHYYAVIFSSQRTEEAREDYEAAAQTMVELASKQPGFLGVESARGADGFGITVSYWDSLEAIRRWKDVPAHAATRARGKKTFYERYEVRVCAVDRGYKFPT
jgi:glutathione S-transferase/heme-degrading monooxygenase HmoA